MLRTGLVSRNVRQVHFGFLTARKFDLGLFSGVLQTLQGKHIAAEINAVVLLEFGDQVFDQATVKVFAAQERVAVGGKHFELLVTVNVGDVDHGDIERAAAQVIDADLAVFVAHLVKTESQSCGRRFVDDALDFETGNAAGVLGGLTLAVVEVGRNRDHGFGHRFAEVVFGGFLHLAEHFGGNLLRSKLLVAHHLHPCVAVVGADDLKRSALHVLLHFGVFITAADQALDGKQRVLRVGHGLTLGGCADKNLAVFHVGNDGRRRTSAFGIFDHTNLVAFHDGHSRVGGAKVNTDDLRHCSFSS